MCKKKAQSRKTLASNGFSLIDLLFTLMLCSILLGLAFPAYRHLIIEIRLLVLTERITSAINYARSEAAKRRCVVILCKSKDGKTCAGQWRDGWIIFFGRYTMSPPENKRLQVYSALNKNEFLEWHGSGGREYLQLNPDGSARGHNGSFLVCVKVLSKKAIWLVKISTTGRMRVDKEGRYRWNCN